MAFAVIGTEKIMQKIFLKEFKAGEKWSGFIGKGKYIHFKSLGDNANISVLLYNLIDRSERYNMPDTLKAQYTAHLTRGNVLMSDNGRVLGKHCRRQSWMARFNIGTYNKNPDR